MSILLHHVCDFVSEEFAAVLKVGIELAGGEEDIVALGKGAGVEVLGEGMGGGVVVEFDVGEVGVEMVFELGAQGRGDWLAEFGAGALEACGEIAGAGKAWPARAEVGARRRGASASSASLSLSLSAWQASHLRRSKGPASWERGGALAGGDWRGVSGVGWGEASTNCWARRSASRSSGSFVAPTTSFACNGNDVVDGLGTAEGVRRGAASGLKSGAERVDFLGRAAERWGDLAAAGVVVLVGRLRRA